MMYPIPVRPRRQELPGARRWYIALECAGTPFVWNGTADTEREAIALARLAAKYSAIPHGMDDVRVAICLERRP